MRHRKHTFKIGRSGAHRKAMLANMVCSLFENGQIRTTLVKAKEARRLAEKMITRAKTGELHSRRLVIAKLRNKEIVKLLFNEVAPRYNGRDGGYTRIIRIGTRLGDAAEMCILQLLDEEVKPKKSSKKKSSAKTVEKDAVTTPANAEEEVSEKEEAKS